jgi:hypothetical protein
MKDKIFWISLIIAILVSGVIMLVFKDGVTRFTLVMPVFAGFLFFNILMLEE